MRYTSELRSLEQAQIEPRRGSRSGTHEAAVARAAAADAFGQLSGPMIALVDAGLITISDNHGILGADCAVAVLADPANWCSTKPRR